ncbi:MAG: TRAM domain-containing protein, partial [Deferribacteraceae bacterium]|nr:TRAM domain-containing protein [Deferribacteraceae bacterium]
MIVQISDTAYRGNGVGRTADGKAVFVPYTVTGDEIRIEIVEDKGSYAIGELKEIIKPSDWRAEAHCPHHGSCGGCHFGHIRYDKQLEIKRNIVLQALRKHPQQALIAEKLKVFSAKPLGYRIRANVRMMDGKAGFYKANSHDFIPVKNCPVIASSLWEKCHNFAVNCNSGSLAVMKNTEGL